MTTNADSFLFRISVLHGRDSQVINGSAFVPQGKHVEKVKHEFLKNRGLATLEAFSCFFFLTNLSLHVFLMGNRTQRAVR